MNTFHCGPCDRLFVAECEAGPPVCRDCGGPMTRCSFAQVAAFLDRLKRIVAMPGGSRRIAFPGRKAGQRGSAALAWRSDFFTGRRARAPGRRLRRTPLRHTDRPAR